MDIFFCILPLKEEGNLGRKKGTGLAAVPFVQRTGPRARIFVSRVRPSTTVDQIRDFVRSIAGVDAVVDRIQTRSDKYASFLVQVEKAVEKFVLDPDEWEEGLIIRPFRGYLRRPDVDQSRHDDTARGPLSAAPVDPPGAHAREDQHSVTQEVTVVDNI